jgi:hypothetical protein
MNKKLFAELVESVRQMDGIVRGKREPARVFHVGRKSGKVAHRRKRTKRAARSR